MSTYLDQTEAADCGIIPHPRHLELGGGTFTLTPETVIVYPRSLPDAQKGAEALQRRIHQFTGHRLPLVKAESDQRGVHQIVFQSAGYAPHLRTEGYKVVVDRAGISIQASAGAGFFYGAQTVAQLLPAGKFDASYDIPIVRITDYPRFRWRGLMLDVVRHFIPKEDILRHLDAMAMHKLNFFHWHLTDDQGWRVEIKKHPALTQVGAFRKGTRGELTPSASKVDLELDGEYGGFYTQEDIAEVVRYAADRHITVVPEIEMPGHAMAALAAYPELSCTGNISAVCTRMGILKDVYCVGNEKVFDLMFDVLSELVPLFPSPFFHIGGDECPRDRWNECPKCNTRVKEAGLGSTHDLQGYMVNRIGKFLAERGKRLIGWDEILDGPLPAGATVTSWRGTKGCIAAAKSGHDVVMAPYSHCYLDYSQAAEGEPLAIEGLITLEKAYSFEPVPEELGGAEARHVIGLQGNLWTEYVYDQKHVEYMTWPRGAALAEVGWTPADLKDYEDFLVRLRAHEKRLSAAGINYRAEPAPAVESFGDVTTTARAG